MATNCSGRNNIHGHPCFGGNQLKNGRIHLAVAPSCNIKCRYCTRKHDCVNESRPGVASRIQTPLEALETVRNAMASNGLHDIIKVVGIAGPGDPLANDETFETFRLIGGEFPQLIKCLSTNGLLLPESLDVLAEIGLGSLTVTINAVDAGIGGLIYKHVRYHGKRYSSKEGGELLIANQFAGVEKAVELGLIVKVNTVLIPGVNEGQIPLIAERVKQLGAFVMNVMPLIPQADFAHIVPPSPEELEVVRSANERIIGQFRHCRQCRADAIGLIGHDSQLPGSGCSIAGNVAA